MNSLQGIIMIIIMMVMVIVIITNSNDYINSKILEKYRSEFNKNVFLIICCVLKGDKDFK